MQETEENIPVKKRHNPMSPWKTHIVLGVFLSLFSGEEMTQKLGEWAWGDWEATVIG